VRDVVYKAEHSVLEPNVVAEIDLLKRHLPPPHLGIADPLWSPTKEMCDLFNSNK
jgi:hypothetical protein